MLALKVDMSGEGASTRCALLPEPVCRGKLSEPADEKSMKGTLQVLNELESAGVLNRYAIGGAMAATFYLEPLLTFDLDVFVALPQFESGLLMDRRSTCSVSSGL